MRSASVSPGGRRSMSKGPFGHELYDVFISFRYAEAHAEANALKAALEAQQLKVFICNVEVGEDIQADIARALRCRLAVLLLSRTSHGHLHGKQV